MLGPGPGRPGTPRRLRIAARRITAAPAKPASVCGLLRIEDNGPAAGPLRPGRSVSGRAGGGGGPATRQCRDDAGVGDGACIFSCRRCHSAVYRIAAPKTLKKRRRGRDAAAGHRQGAAGPWGRAVNWRREGAEGGGAQDNGAAGGVVGGVPQDSEGARPPPKIDTAASTSWWGRRRRWTGRWRPRRSLGET